MKVKVINRSEEACTRECSQDVLKVHRNLDPTLHPLEKAKEYTRALNAVKLRRVFAKPFVRALPHDDGVTCLARSPVRINCVLSGSADGVARVWDVAAGRCLRRLIGHTSAVRGAAVTVSGNAAVTASADATVRLWRVPFAPAEAGPDVGRDEQAVAEWTGPNGFRDVDHHATRPRFATCGADVCVWDHERGDPVSRYAWGADTIAALRFNPAEPDVLASAGSDRAVTLYDVRQGTPLRKVIMQTKSSSLSWNPQEAFHLLAGNDDGCCYTYDMRNLSAPRAVHEGFVSAVTDVDWSPTGAEFAAAGYDRSIRIFARDAARARDVYHTKRMQRVAAVRYSADASYIFSGSDDMNVRVWKALASAREGVQLPREKKAQAYADALVQRHVHLPEIRRIAGHRHLPAPLFRASKRRQIQVDAERRKEKNRAANSGKSYVPPKSHRTKKVIAELE